MRIILFGTRFPFALASLEALVQAGHDLLFVLPDIPLRSKFKRSVLRNWPAPEAFARRHGVPVGWYRPAQAPDMVARFRPDLLCIATFPERLPANIVALAPLGAINVHPSLLPRQRGPQTVFSIYCQGDFETGVTVHRVTPQIDAGPIIVQQAIPIPRGYPAERLSDELLRMSGPLMARAVELVAAGAPETPQDDAAATRGERFDAAGFRAPIETWPVEQSWHFLAGFCSRFRQPLADATGQAVHYSAVGGYQRRDVTLRPGTVEPMPGGWLLYCRGGVIELLA